MSKAPANPPMARADRLLANLGYGSRREVQTMIQSGGVIYDGAPLLDIGRRIPFGPDLIERMTVRGQPVDPPAPFTLIMNKPPGVVCSHREPGRSVYELLPSRWRSRDPALSSIGRLDVDTTGLLLITDDGDLLHRVISPKSAIPKRYLVGLARPLDGAEGKIFASGELVLSGETSPLSPAQFEALGAASAAITITEGRYHQVRRMFSAVGNHVVHLHRELVGNLAIPEDLSPGQFRPLRPEEHSALFDNII